MFKKPLTYWIIAVLLFLASYIGLSTFRNYSFEADNAPFIILEMGAITLTYLLVGAVLSALIALIPLKGWKYIKRFWLILPICVSLLICYLMYSYKKVQTKKFNYENSDGPSQDYNKVQVADSLTCLSVHDGKFETKTLIIERKGENQTQVQRGRTDTLKYKVKWVSPCEYYLLPNGDSTEEIMEVKIITVTRRGYDCYVTLSGREDRANLYHLKKINDQGAEK